MASAQKVFKCGCLADQDIFDGCHGGEQADILIGAGDAHTGNLVW